MAATSALSMMRSSGYDHCYILSSAACSLTLAIDPPSAKPQAAITGDAMKRHAMLVTAILMSSTSAASADWLEFRGPGGLGISTDKSLPVTWSAKQGVVWKTELPGYG